MANQPGVNVPNSNDQGGAVTHINGSLLVESGGIVEVKSGGSLLIDAGATLVAGVDQSIRARLSTAQVNAGATVLPAVPGYKYRMIGAKMIAIGADATAVTTVDLLGTQATAGVKLMAGAQASLTRSAVVSAGGAGGAVLADGASFVQNDVNTAITIGHTGGALAGSTAIDVILTYALEP